MLRGTLVGVLLLTIVGIALPWPAGAETRIALVIGNSAYPSRPLGSPKDDAKAIEAKLKVLGFQVTRKTDLGREEFFDAIRDFGDLLQQPSTVGLFYYSGHGTQVNNRNYMIPTDANIRSEVDVGRYAVPVEDVLARMEWGKSNLNVVILDACRENPFEKRFKSSQDGLAQMDAPASTLIAFAAAPETVAEAGSGGKLSLYTAALAEQIDQPYPNFIDMFRTVQNIVYKLSAYKQSPRLELSPGLPDFSFKPVVSGTIPQLERFLQDHPGVFDWQVYNQLRHLYGAMTPPNLRKAMEHADVILQHSLMDDYILNILSDWQIDKDTSMARANLLMKAESFPDLRFLVAACFLKIGDLYAVEGTSRIAQSFYLKVTDEKSSDMEQYRVLAKERLIGLTK